MRPIALIVVASCWSTSAPPPLPPPPPLVVETGPFHIVFERAGRCDRPAFEHAGKLHACEYAWDARTGIYSGRGRSALAVLADGRLVSTPEPSTGLDVDGKRVDPIHIYKPTLSPDGKHFAYIAEHFTPDYHQTIVVRETARWTVEFDVAQPQVKGESYNSALGWLGDRLFVAVASPSCIGKNPCTELRLAAVTASGVAASGPDHAARRVGFAADGSAIAIATATNVQVYGVPFEGEPLATLDLAAEKLAADKIQDLAVAPGGLVVAMPMFDDHGVVVYERRGHGFASGGKFPGLVGTKLAFSRAGDALYATGTVTAALRRTRTPPVFDFPPLALDGTGFDVEDCADAHPHGFYCNTDHHLRMRFETPDTYAVRVEVHVSPAAEFAPTRTLDAWTAMLRDRFVFAPADIREHVELGLRSWQTPRGRQLEFHHQIRESCRPADAFTRIAEVDGLLWRVTVEVPPESPQTEVDPLLARFIDGWLGPPVARIARQMPAPSSTVECATF